MKQKKSLDYTRLGITGDTLFKVKKCLNCGFLFVNPRIQKQFEDLIYNESKKTMYSQDFQRSDGAQQRNERKRKFAHLSPLLQTCAYVGIGQNVLKLFDFGCGYGYNMELAQMLKIEAYGVDIERQGARAKDFIKKESKNLQRRLNSVPFGIYIELNHPVFINHPNTI